jgi:hypothetical protein
MCGALSFDGDITVWSPEVTAHIARLVQIYRAFRHLLVADFYPLTPHPLRPAEGEVVEFASRDGAEAVVLGFAGAEPVAEVRVRPRGLKATATYLVWDPLTGQEGRYDGRALAEDGLTLALAQGAAVYQVREIGRADS